MILIFKLESVHKARIPQIGRAICGLPSDRDDGQKNTIHLLAKSDIFSSSE